MSTIPRSTRRTQKVTPPPGKSLTVATDERILVIPPDAFTLEGFRDWATADDFPEGVRALFDQGEVVLDMINEDPEAHVRPKGEISRVVMNLCVEHELGEFYPDGVLLSNPEAGISNNPDALFFTQATYEAGRIRLVPRKSSSSGYRELEGTPDWVFEVVSDSSVQKDTTRLRQAYHRAGIPEYWLLDARGDEVNFQILLWRKTGYSAAPIKDGWQRSKVFGRSFRLVRWLNDIGLWRYRLEVRED